MPRSAPAQTNFSNGEISPLVRGRTDLDRYKASLDYCLNWIPTLQGGLIRRPGTYFVAETKDSGQVRLVNFEFSVTQAYILEFGSSYIRFYKDRTQITDVTNGVVGATQANPVVITTTAAHGLSNGNRVVITGVGGMTQINNREFVVAGATATTFQLNLVGAATVDGTGFGAFTSGGSVDRIYEISSPVSALADIETLKFVQSDDVLYILHPLHAPQKLTRAGHTSWTLSYITFVDGPYLPTNTTAVTITPSATTGSVTLTASSATFASTDATSGSIPGRLVRIKHGSTWGNARITAFTSSTLVTASVISAFGAATASADWRLGVWSTTTGYPTCATFHEDRLCIAGGAAAPQRIDMSVSADYESFRPTATDGTVADSNAVSITINTNDINLIRFMASDEKGMVVLSAGGEFVVRAASQTSAITPTSVVARPQSSFGSSAVSPVRAGRATLFVQRNGRKIRECAFDFYTDGFRSTDMSVLAEHLTAPGIRELAFQKEKQPLLWVVLNDGTLASLTYERDIEELRAGWARHILGGVSVASGAGGVSHVLSMGPATSGTDNVFSAVESVACIPSNDTISESSYYETWFATRRCVNGGTKRYVEFLTDIWDSSFESNSAHYVDCGLQRANDVVLTAATKASPVVITCGAGHGFVNGDMITIDSVSGMTELNHKIYKLAGNSGNTFQLNTAGDVAIDGTAYGTYLTGGRVQKHTASVSGLMHLEGEVVSILADGAVQSATVTSGAVTISPTAAFISVGWAYNSDVRLLRFDSGSEDGTSIGKTRRMNRIGVLVEQAQGLLLAVDTFTSMDRILIRNAASGMSHGASLFSGIISVTCEASYNLDNKVCLRMDQPFPATILSVLPKMLTEDGG